jgi:hypothetical protein
LQLISFPSLGDAVPHVWNYISSQEGDSPSQEGNIPSQEGDNPSQEGNNPS